MSKDIDDLTQFLWKQPRTTFVGMGEARCVANAVQLAGWVSPDVGKHDIHNAIQGTRDGMIEAGYVKVSPNQDIPKLYPEMFAEGMRLPDQNELQRYRNVINWLIHDCGWRRVEADNG